MMLMYRHSSGPPGSIRAEGTIKNFNTIKEFKSADFTAILHHAGKQVLPSFPSRTDRG